MNKIRSELTVYAHARFKIYDNLNNPTSLARQKDQMLGLRKSLANT